MVQMNILRMDDIIYVTIIANASTSQSVCDMGSFSRVKKHCCSCCHLINSGFLHRYGDVLYYKGLRNQFGATPLIPLSILGPFIHLTNPPGRSLFDWGAKRASLYSGFSGVPLGLRSRTQ